MIQQSQLMRRRVHGVFTLTDTLYPAGYAMPAHGHPCASMSFVIEGAFSDCVGRNEREGLPERVFFRPVGEEHRVAFNIDSQILNIALTEQAGFATKIGASTLHCSGPGVFLFKRIYEEFRDPDELSPLIIEELALHLLGFSSRKDFRQEAPRWLKHFDWHLDECFREQISLSALAKVAGVHHVHLAKTYRRQHGCTIGDSIRIKRVDHARKLLRAGVMPLGDIAIDCGFADQAHFCRTFKKLTSLTPQQFRAAHLG